MISKLDMKRYIGEGELADTLPFVYKEEEDALYARDGRYLSSLDCFLDYYRKKSGESFECIYYSNLSLLAVLRCTECGTVIFSSEDERYDPGLKCPTCTGYKTSFEFWTKEEIESDKNKQNSMKWFEYETNWINERDKRIERRNGKNDWEIAIKEFYGKKRYLKISLECNNITESYLKGLRLKIEIGKKEFDNDFGYVINKFYTIPLSWSSFLMQFKGGAAWQ